MTRETCRDCEKKRTATDAVIEGTNMAFPLPPQQKSKPPVQAAEGAYRAVCEAGLPQGLLDELLGQIEARKAERDAEKPIGTKLNSARARLQRATTRGARAKAAMEEAKEKFHEAMKELTEANTELQELMAGSISIEVSTEWFRRGLPNGGSDGTAAPDGGTLVGPPDATNRLAGGGGAERTKGAGKRETEQEQKSSAQAAGNGACVSAAPAHPPCHLRVGHGDRRRGDTECRDEETDRHGGRFAQGDRGGKEGAPRPPDVRGIATSNAGCTVVQEAQDDANRRRPRCLLDNSQIDECVMEGLQDETPLLEGRAAGEDPPPRSLPSGSGRSMLQCDVHKKHARKGQELCRVCARVVPQWCYACLRCGERFCSAACKNLALSARICGQDVRLGMMPQNRAEMDVAQDDSISQRVTTQDHDFQPMHVDDSDRTHSMLERVTDSPVLRTARLKSDLEARFITLFRDAMAQHAGAEELAEKHPSREAQLRAETAGRCGSGC